MKYLVTIFIFTFSCLSSLASDGSTLLAAYFKVSSKKLNKDTLTFNIDHISYNLKSNIAKEKYSGFYKRAGENFYSYMVGVTTIQNANCTVVLDTSDRTLYVKDPEKLFFDQKSVIKQTDFKDFIVSQSSEKDGACSFMLIPKDKKMKIKLLFSFNRDSIMTKYRFENLEDKISETNATAGMAIEIRLYNFNMHPNLRDVLFFSTDTYFYERDKKIFPTQKYKKYEISDLRIKKYMK